MPKSWYWKVGFVGVFIVLCILYILPSLISLNPEKDKGGLPAWYTDVFSSRLKLGLDLQGGMHLVYSVKADKAVADKLERFAEDIMEQLKTKKVPYLRVFRPEGEFNVQLRFPTAKAYDDYYDKVFKGEDFYKVFSERRRVDKGKKVVLIPKDTIVEETRKKAVDQAIETIRNRIDKLGVEEPSISKLTGNDIQVQLPGIQNPERAKELIGQPAQLEFKIVDDDNDFIEKIPEALWKKATLERRMENVEGPRGSSREVYYLFGRTKKDLVVFFKTLPKEIRIPSDHQIGFGKMEVEEESKGKVLKGWRTYYLHRKTRLTGEYISDANVRIDDQKRKPYVGLDFNRTGAKLFEKITGENVKQRMAIILDDEVNSAPIIQQKIGGGRAQITLGGLKPYDALLKDAKDLSLVLRAGALPAPIVLQEERRVGATLGSESVQKGAISMLVAVLLVILFMAMYYRIAGLIADFILVLNLVIILAVLVGLGATLTLPGIAGLVLTIGMAVDANVIIYERIREEVRLGKTPRAAVDAGYQKALSTILDANITTAIAGFVLWQYGSGPIRGFAVV